MLYYNAQIVDPATVDDSESNRNTHAYPMVECLGVLDRKHDPAQDHFPIKDSAKA